MNIDLMGSWPLVLVGLLSAACGGTERSTVGDSGTIDAGETRDVTSGYDARMDARPARTACIPGRSVECVGSGGCSSNQVCNSDGSSYGPCECVRPDASISEGSATTLCVPGQSIACAGRGGCISNQICNATGTGYAPCSCTNDGSALLCVPGESIACSGPGGCFSSQVCEGDGMAYGPCACFGDGGSVECATSSDCETLLGPLPTICIFVCPPGSKAKADGCGDSTYPLHYICVLGVCQTTYCD